MGHLFSTMFSTEDHEDSEEYSSTSEDDPESMDEEEFDESGIALDRCTVTDAVGTSPLKISLNSRQVVELEMDLEDYEKISLIYLLYDRPDDALAEAKAIVSGQSSNFLQKWVDGAQIHFDKWAEKIVEALCTIQNFQVLKKFGFDKQQLQSIHPHQYFTCVHINKFRKALYFLCEKLDSVETRLLLNALKFDCCKKITTIPDLSEDFLEIYLLYFESVRYIKQNDLSSLSKILKKLDFLDLCEDLKSFTPRPDYVNNENRNVTLPAVSTKNKNKTFDDISVKKRHELLDKILDDKTSLSDLTPIDSLPSTSFDSSASNDRTHDIYPINPETPGVCLIINQKHFYKEVDPEVQHLLPNRETSLEKRLGTDKDRDSLRNVFKSFGYRVIVKDDLTHSEIVEEISEVVRNVDKEESSLFVCVLTHGAEGVVYGVNSCQVKVKEIKEIMCDAKLMGRPKILILQSCQGNECQKIPDECFGEDGLTRDGPSKAAVIKDLFTFWATVPGYSAIRHKSRGTFFIQSFCDKLQTRGNDTHFEDICTDISKDVTDKKWADNIQVPQRESTLLKKFYLPKLNL